MEVLLHLGQHKTGSKALQAFLAANQGPLGRAGIAYPLEERPRHGVPAYARSHFRLYALLRAEALAATGDAAGARSLLERTEAARGGAASVDALLDEALAVARRLGARRLVLSAEDLLDLATAQEVACSLPLVREAARSLARRLAARGADARAVVYLRRQDHLLAAHHVQHVKGGGATAPEGDLDFAAFARAFAPRLDARALLEPWEEALGRDRVLVRPYEPARMEGGIVADFFARALGGPPPRECAPPAEDVESVNRSPGRHVVEVLRSLARERALGRDVPGTGAVLEAALRLGPAAHGPQGAAAWLSPAERRALLDAHAEGNAAIARAHLGREALFEEPPPADDPSWAPYEGLPAEVAARIVALAREVQRERRGSPWARIRRRLGW